MYRGSGKSLARPGMKQANVSVRMAWISFGAFRCMKKETWWQLAPRCCWNRARPWHASEFVSFLVGLRTYQHPGTYTRRHWKQLHPHCSWNGHWPGLPARCNPLCYVASSNVEHADCRSVTLNLPPPSLWPANYRACRTYQPQTMAQDLHRTVDSMSPLYGITGLTSPCKWPASATLREPRYM